MMIAGIRFRRAAAGKFADGRAQKFKLVVRTALGESAVPGRRPRLARVLVKESPAPKRLRETGGMVFKFAIAGGQVTLGARAKSPDIQHARKHERISILRISNGG